MSRSEKIICRVLSAVAMALLIAAVCLASAISIATSKSFYDNQFARLDVAANLDANIDEVTAVRDELLEFLFGKSKELPQFYLNTSSGTVPFYTRDEIYHMEDVKAVFTAVRIARDIFASAAFLTAVGLSLYFALKIKRFRKDGIYSRDYLLDIPHSVSIGALSGVIAFTAFVGIIGVAVAIDFDWAFDIFHAVFFPQGNYLFPYDSNMLRLLPQDLFNSAAVRIVVTTVVAALICAAASVIGLTVAKRAKAIDK